MIRSILAAACAGALALTCPPTRACGEGSFNMGQGLRYQGYLAPHPASVLVYDDGTSDRKAVYAGLRRAGHAVTVVGSADAMSQALRTGRFDVVIADFDDAAALPSHASTAVLPLVARNRRNAPEVSSRFRLVLPDGAGLGQYLKGINQLLSLRAP